MGPKVDLEMVIKRVEQYSALHRDESIMPLRIGEAAALIARVRDLEAENERLKSIARQWEGIAAVEAEEELRREFIERD